MRRRRYEYLTTALSRHRGRAGTRTRATLAGGESVEQDVGEGSIAGHTETGASSVGGKGCDPRRFIAADAGVRPVGRALLDSRDAVGDGHRVRHAVAG